MSSNKVVVNFSPGPSKLPDNVLGNYLLYKRKMHLRQFVVTLRLIELNLFRTGFTSGSEGIALF